MKLIFSIEPDLKSRFLLYHTRYKNRRSRRKHSIEKETSQWKTLFDKDGLNGNKNKTR